MWTGARVATWQARRVLITTHVFSGAVIGALAPDLPTAVSRGFVSHFVLDAIPHWGTDAPLLLRVAVPDGLVGLAAIAVVGAAAEPSRRVQVLAGVFGACLPDLDKPGELFFGRSPFPRWFDWFHGVIQRERPERWRQEVVTAVALGAVAVVVLRGQARWCGGLLESQRRLRTRSRCRASLGSRSCSTQAGGGRRSKAA
jgi:hypothetical protein